ncbi:hypothetical protein BST27_18175 [Mycobacterium intermedium]|uniref:Uncharacterized protein n=1 Tax=Mycobacterium intermedium TaxID=28445 RepID=A0A1E3S5Y1_MYCIE|nr:hypothetical protein [Mycobacterium intermedium]ODQ97566.1 hypothetical protein BHQ20_26090 [Mycobacterium intermedium]OPE49695.1 hypothetical protein BV508_13220 [Mycobacterium intermedium]ORB00682.1 hypothetical protein BST27_18175 [Mycobacterium intermedium]
MASGASESSTARAAAGGAGITAAGAGMTAGGTGATTGGGAGITEAPLLATGTTGGTGVLTGGAGITDAPLLAIETFCGTVIVDPPWPLVLGTAAGDEATAAWDNPPWTSS